MEVLVSANEQFINETAKTAAPATAFKSTAEKIGAQFKKTARINRFNLDCSLGGRRNIGLNILSSWGLPQYTTKAIDPQSQMAVDFQDAQPRNTAVGRVESELENMRQKLHNDLSGTHNFDERPGPGSRGIVC